MFDKKIKDVMTSPATCLGPHATVQEAARKMRDVDIGTVVCCDESGAAVGIVTDRDIAVRCMAEGKSGDCRLAEIMTRDIVTCSEEDSLKEAEELMESKQIRRLVVTGSDRRVRGVVALSDIVGVDRRMTGRIVEKVSQPASSVH